MSISILRSKKVKSYMRDSSDSSIRTDSRVKYKRDTSVNAVMRIYGKIEMKRKLDSLKDLKIDVKPEVARKSNIFSMNRPESLTTLNKNSHKLSKSNLVENEIMKAKSDLFDLKRDLATYDYNLLNAINEDKKLESTLVFLTKNFSSNFEKYSECISKNNDLIQSINSALAPSLKIGGKAKSSIFLNIYQKKTKVFVSSSFSYQCIMLISGVRCPVSVKSSDDLHKIECLLAGKKSLTLFVYKTFPSFSDTKEYSIHLKNSILPYLFFDISTNEIFLQFNENLGKEFLTFYIYLKGAGNELVKIQDAIENFIIEAKSTLLVSKSLFGLQELSLRNSEKIKNIIKSDCYMYNSSLYWAKDPFIARELSSDIVNGKILERLLDESFRKIFFSKFKFKGKSYKLDIFETGSEKFVEISSSKFTYTVIENSPESHLLKDLQNLDLSISPATLLKSLEFGLLIELVFAYEK